MAYFQVMNPISKRWPRTHHLPLPYKACLRPRTVSIHIIAVRQLASLSAASDSPPVLKKREAVGSFIFKYPEDGGRPQVALFKRSGDVRYPHKLGSISGSIEISDASPLAAAWRELDEETKLTSSSLELLHIGKPYSYSEWTVHPFAFRLKAADDGDMGKDWIQLGPEHVAWQWYDPRDVVDSVDFGGVPNIGESLSRVWFEKRLGQTAGGRLTRGLQRLKAVPGPQEDASLVTGAALQLFHDVVEELDDTLPLEQWWKDVRFVAWNVWKNGPESNGPAIRSNIIGMLSRILRAHGLDQISPGVARKAQALKILRQRISERNRKSATKIVKSFAAMLLEDLEQHRSQNQAIKILALSDGSTIAEVLLNVIQHRVVNRADFCIDLRILESKSQGLPIKSQSRLQVISYATIGQASVGVDMVLVGADYTTASVGAAMLMTKRSSPNARIIVLSDIENIAPADANTIDIYMTDVGRLSSRDIEELCRSNDETEQRLFGDM